MFYPFIHRLGIAQTLVLPVLVLASVVAAGSARAQMLLNVDFKGTQFGSVAGRQQTGAAVVGSAGDVWNTFTSGAFPATATNASLLAANNTASGVSMSFSFDGGYGAGERYANNTGNNFAPTPYVGLMTDWFASYSQTTPSTITLTGLAPNAAFALYLYSESNQANRPALFSTSGSAGSLTLNSNPNEGSFDLNSNYGVINTVSDASGVLTISMLQGSGNEADLNGFQLQQVAVPEPSTVCLGAVGAVLLGLVINKRTHRLV